jgi:Suppressor of fused protein (SUFU)
MSDKAMKKPDKSPGEYYLELLLRLPAGWPVGDEAKWKEEKNYWPIRLLKTIARFPHKYDAFLWTGHTLDNGQPATPWSNGTTFDAAFLAPSRTLPEKFETLTLENGRKIKFLALYPVYHAESALARREGANALWEKFVERGITDVVDPARRSVVGGSAPTGGKSMFWNRLFGRN